MSPGLFAWAYAIGNFVPGPKCSFVAGIGYFLAGFPGALACLVGISIPTVVGASLASHWHDHLKRYVALFIPASGFVIAGMMLTAGMGLALNITIDPVEYLLVTLIVLGVWLRRWDPGVVVLCSAGRHWSPYSFVWITSSSLITTKLRFHAREMGSLANKSPPVIMFRLIFL